MTVSSKMYHLPFFINNMRQMGEYIRMYTNIDHLQQLETSCLTAVCLFFNLPVVM